MCTQWRPPLMPEKAITLRLPTPAETLSGTAWASAFIRVSATMLPETKRAMVGAGNSGLAMVPFGATMVMGRISPEFCGMWPCTALSSRMERTVSQIAQSTVPSSGMLMGRSSHCRDVPVRSTVIASPSTVAVTTILKCRRSGSSRKPSTWPSARQAPSGSAAMAWRMSRSEWSMSASDAASTVARPWRSISAR